MRWAALVAVCVIIPSAPRAEAQASAQPGPERFAEAWALIQQWMARDSVPGLTIAVTRGDSILWEEGFGWANREVRVPATPETPFYLASLNKTIVATAAMVLRARGLLTLDRPANDYLGPAKLWSPAWDPAAATVRTLATHTSGLTTFDLGCPVEAPSCALPDLAEKIRKYGVLIWPAGEHYDYSNLGYEVLGEVVARAGGKDLDALLRDDLFRPLGMRQSSMGIAPALARETAVPYMLDGSGRPTPNEAVQRYGLASYSSVHDLALFGMFHMKVHPRGQTAVLTDEAIDSMQSSTVDAGGGSRYGIGWSVEDDRFGYRSVLAQGGVNGSTAWLRLVPGEQIGVAVLANRGVGFPSQVIDAVIAALLPRYRQELDAQRLRAANPQPAPPVPTRLDSALVGTWRGTVLTPDGNGSPDGNVSLTLAVADTGAAQATLGVEARSIVGRARQGRTLFVVALPGSLDGTADSNTRLDFYFRRRGDRLTGLVTTSAPARSGLIGRVSYWVELRKSP